MVTERIHIAMLELDVSFVARFVEKEFGVELSNGQLQKITAAGSRLKEPWSDYSWRTWLKNRVVEIATLPSSPCSRDIKFRSAIMHIFFIHIEETEQMIRRLRNEKPLAETREARSKIFNDDSRIPVPIDSTAEIVSRNQKGIEP